MLQISRSAAVLLLPGLAALLLPACVSRARARTCCPEAPAWKAPAAPAPQAPAQDEPPRPPKGWLGRPDGTPIQAEDLAGLAGEADLVAFGELHGHPIGAEFQLALLQGLAAQARPIALALEFFERDTQPALDAYMAGEIDAEALATEGRQGRDFAATHLPLLRFAKEHGIPVMAANSPRLLVRAWRKAPEEVYADWLATLTEEERGWLPRDSTRIDDAYKKRFYDLMGPERSPTFFKSQSLWDDAMAETVADFRTGHPDHRVLLVIGAFHVTEGLGTITKYALRRPDDRVFTLVMKPVGTEAELEGPDEDHAVDAILRVTMPRRAGP